MFQFLCVASCNLFVVLSHMCMTAFKDAFDLYYVFVILQIAVIFGRKAEST